MTGAASEAQGRGENMSNSKSVGLGFCDVLLIVFIVLKLIGVINWSWSWVLAPLWIPVLLVVIGFLVSLIFD